MCLISLNSCGLDRHYGVFQWRHGRKNKLSLFCWLETKIFRWRFQDAKNCLFVVVVSFLRTKHIFFSFFSLIGSQRAHSTVAKTTTTPTTTTLTTTTTPTTTTPTTMIPTTTTPTTTTPTTTTTTTPTTSTTTTTTTTAATTSLFLVETDQPDLQLFRSFVFSVTKFLDWREVPLHFFQKDTSDPMNMI